MRSRIEVFDTMTDSMRRIALLALSLLGLLLVFRPVEGQAPPPKPNIIFILVDDMGWGDVGAFWQNQRKANNDRTEPWQRTPALDALAASGAMLTNHYTAAPVCAPSRASLLLGVHQGHANVRDNQFDKALQDTHTLGTVLKQAGYHTAAIGKWGLQGGGRQAAGPDQWPAYPLKRGFDYFLGYVRHRDGHEHYPKEALYRNPAEVWENDANIAPQLDKTYTADLWTAAAKRYITQQARTRDAQPFFLYLAYDTPHAVLELPTQAYPAGGGLKGGLQWVGEPGHMINTASGEVDSYVYPEYASATYDHDDNPATPEVHWPETYQRYASSCRRIDDGVGDLVQLLRDLGLYDNTLIVFSSDNGPSKESYLGDEQVPNEADFFNSFGPFDGIKRDTWEGGVREPAIVSWPARIPADQVIAEPSAMYDWMATFAEAAGIPAPARSDGVSLLPLLSGERESVAHPVYVEYFNNQKTPEYGEFQPAHRGRARNQMQLIRLGDFSGVRYDIQSAGDDFEIYNVVEDPQQSEDLGGKPAFQGLQALMKASVLQMRQPDQSATRPYDEALAPAVEPRLPTEGLSRSAYPGEFPWAADVSGLEPAARGVSGGLDASVLDKPGMLVFEGLVQVPADGEYRFSLETETVAVIRMHDALLLDEGVTEASIRLAAGFHPIRVYCLKKTGREKALDLRWKGSDGKSGSSFYRAAEPTP